MKRLLLMLAAMLYCVASYAVPAKPGLFTVTQSDGTTVTLSMVGDEWHHSLVTTDGLTVDRSDDGNVYYRNAAGLTAVLAHNVSDRAAAEQAFVTANADALRLGAIESTAARARRASAGPRRVGSTQVPTTGTPRVPIILVEYTDKKMSNSKETFETSYTGTARQYFIDQSNGKYQPQFDVYGIYTLSSSRATYGGNDSNGNDKGVAKMVGEAIDKAGNDIDWSLYDNDGDGEADVVIVLYAGVGEAQASQTVPNAIWPCQWQLSSGPTYGDGTGARTRNGVKIDRFAVFNEINGSNDNSTTLDGVGTFCHEFSHCLGLPDFYETTYTYGYYGIGAWSLMDYGSYNNDGYTPIGYSAYEKNFMGWIDYITPTPGKQYTLTALNQGSEATDQAVKITSPLNSNEYYVLENRKQQGWDEYIADEGLMVTHVTYMASRWEANTVNNQSIQLFTIIPADNKLTTASESTDLYGESNHALTDTSTPAAKLNMTASGSLASTTGGAGYMSQPVTEINLNNDGTVSFWYMKGEISPLDAPVLAEAGDVNATSFTASWTDDIDLDHNYTLYVYKKPSYTEVLTADFSNSTTTWTKSSTYTDVDSYLRLGSSKKTGSVTSPAIDLTNSNGVATVKVTAKYYSNDNGTSMKVSLVNSSGTTLASKTFTLTNSDTEYVAVFTGNASSNNKVKIESTANGKRVLLKSATVYAGDASAAAPARAISETGDENTRTITGITSKSYTVTGLTTDETYQFKVKAVPANEDEAAESDWSNVQEVTLVAPELHPEIVVDYDALDFSELTLGDDPKTLTLGVLATELKDVVTVSLADRNNVFSVNTETISIDDAQEGATITITYDPKAVGTHTATIALSSLDAEDVIVTLTGSAVLNPEIIAEPDALDFETITIGNEPATLTFDVLASQLKEDVTVTLNDQTGFYSVNAKTIAIAEALQGATITVTYDPQEAGTHEASITLSSLDAEDVTITLIGVAELDKQVPELLDAVAGGVTQTSFVAEWTAVPNVETYTLHVQIDRGNAAPALAPVETGNDNDFTVTGITETSYTVNSLKAATTYNYAVKAVYIDGTESDWSNTVQVTTKSVPTAIDYILLGNDVREVRYYNAQGQRLSQPAAGLNIVTITRTDGSQETIKVVR